MWVFRRTAVIANCMMKQCVNIILLSFIAISSNAQFPFESLSKPNIEGFNDWKVYNREESKKKIDFTISISSFYANGDTLTLQLTNHLYETQNSNLRVFQNSKEIDKHRIEFLYVLSPYAKPDSVFIGDFNGDSLTDLKVYLPNHIAAGSYNSYAQLIYLFQKEDGTFSPISFSDYFEGFNNRLERDFDNDGNFEIITQTYQKIDGHSYWCFNLYNYTAGGLINVNIKGDYPILIQLLNRVNFEITKNLTKEKMLKQAIKLPSDYKIYD
jgi:hypothetical protein